VRQTVAENKKRPAGLLLRDHVLNLRQNILFPGRRVGRFLASLILHVRNPDAAEIKRFRPGLRYEE
jgi:hypothetical protein